MSEQTDSPPDRLLIKDLLLRTIVGIKPDERVKKQDVIFNLELLVEVSKSGVSDDIADTVNYRSVCKAIIKLVEESDFHTVEKLATEVARLVLTQFEVTEITVSLEKPGALRFARSVGVVITRRRKDFPS